MSWDKQGIKHLIFFFFEFAGKFIYSVGDTYEGAFRDGCKCGKGQGIIVCDFKYKEI